MSNLTEPQKKLQDIKNKAEFDSSQLKGKNVVMLVGQSGSGKSTTLNMLNKSKFTYKIDDQTGDFEIEAQPNIAKIGHNKSETFLPNVIDDGKENIYCDNPGFYDGRGPEYQISKSFFLQDISNSVNSLKLIIVTTIDNVAAKRGQSVKDTIKQISLLFQDFKPEKDARFIITKVIRGSKTPLQVSCTLKKKLQIDIKSEQVAICYQPDKDNGFVPLTTQEIVGNAPQLKSKCSGPPLSAQAKNYLYQISKDLQIVLQQTINEFKLFIQLNFINLIQSNPSAKQSQLQKWKNFYQDLKIDLNNCTNIQQYESVVSRALNCLKTIGSTDIDLLPMLNKIWQKLKRQIQYSLYLTKMFSSHQIIMQKLTKPLLDIFIQQIKQPNSRNQLTHKDKIKNFFDLKNVQIQLVDENKIKNQVHSFLTKSKAVITAKYQGQVFYSGSQNYSGSQYYSGSKSYAKDVYYEGKTKYQGQVYIHDSKPYSGNKYVSRCTHGFTWFGSWKGCLKCDHSNKSIYYNGTVNCNKTKKYYGQTKYSGQKRCEGSLDFNGHTNYSGSISYQGYTPFGGTYQVQCKQDHHQCSCSQLLQIIKALISFQEQIFYLKSIAHIQIIQLEKIGKKGYQLSQISILDKVQFNSCILLFNQSSTDMKDKIHKFLTSKNINFESNYNGTTSYSGSKAYKGTASYSGRKQCQKVCNYQGITNYSGTLPYNYDQSYSGEISYLSCSNDCIWCTDVSRKTQSYYGSQNFSGNKSYSGKVQYAGSKPYTAEVSYSGSVDYAGNANFSGTVPYSGTHTVNCDQDHHTCDSCQFWTYIVKQLKNREKDYELCINYVKSNKNLFENTVKEMIK